MHMSNSSETWGMLNLLNLLAKLKVVRKASDYVVCDTSTGRTYYNDDVVKF